MANKFMEKQGKNLAHSGLKNMKFLVAAVNKNESFVVKNAIRKYFICK